MLKFITAFASALLICSCASQRLNTPSGRPEVSISASKAKVKSTTISTLSEIGYSLTSESPSLLVFQKQMEPAQSTLFLIGVGNSYYSQPMAVTRMTLVQASSQVKLLASYGGTAQGPFGQVKNMDLTSGRAAQDIQGVLETIKKRSE